MKEDSRIVISIDKQFYADDDEIKIHVWFNHHFVNAATLSIHGPTSRKIDSTILKTTPDETETFIFACGGRAMFENGYYTIRVECENIVSESMFEYYSSKNRFNPRLVK